jgi:hypothetical protein
MWIHKAHHTFVPPSLSLSHYPHSVDCGHARRPPFSRPLSLCRTLSILFSPLSLFTQKTPMATTSPFNLTSPLAPAFPRNYSLTPTHLHRTTISYAQLSTPKLCGRRNTACKATEVSLAEGESSASGGGGENWVPVVPLGALPRGERRVIVQDGETILLLWYKNEVFAIENRSPAEGAYTEGLLNAKLTKVLFPFINLTLLCLSFFLFLLLLFYFYIIP